MSWKIFNWENYHNIVIVVLYLYDTDGEKSWFKWHGVESGPRKPVAGVELIRAVKSLVKVKELSEEWTKVQKLKLIISAFAGFFLPNLKVCRSLWIAIKSTNNTNKIFTILCS